MAVLPTGYQGSTTLSPNVTSYDQLLTRIEYHMGAPLVNIEIHRNQIYSNIDQAIELFSKYAGYSEEYLLFSSSLYNAGSGLKLDTIFNTNPEMYTTDGYSPSAGYDMDLGVMRKVVDVFTVEPGETTGINTLFTMEQATAQQTYYGMLLGQTGYDLVTWQCLKMWLDTREKLLAQKIYFRFDPRTQILRLIPAPGPNASYYGVIGCYVERSIVQMISERWVQHYALALTKINCSNIRGKFPGQAFIGGGTVNYQDFKTEGLAEKQRLEDELIKLGYEAVYPVFSIG